MKRTIAIALTAVLMLALQFPASAASADDTANAVSPYMCSGYSKPTNEQLQSSLATPLIIREEPRGLLASISVSVNEPCDEEFRAEFPSNWMYQANARVEQGDNDIYDWFGIDYLSVAQNEWTSNSIDDYDLYDEVKDEVGKTNGADLMIAFSSQASTYGGLGASDGYALCWEFGLDYTSNTVTHESGHMYGVHRDGGCETDCLMSGQPHNICDYCFGIWDTNKNKY